MPALTAPSFVVDNCSPPAGLRDCYVRWAFLYTRIPDENHRDSQCHEPSVLDPGRRPRRQQARGSPPSPVRPFPLSSGAECFLTCFLYILFFFFAVNHVSVCSFLEPYSVPFPILFPILSHRRNLPCLRYHVLRLSRHWPRRACRLAVAVRACCFICCHLIVSCVSFPVFWLESFCCRVIGHVGNSRANCYESQEDWAQV
jgi:hypothetical protein